MERRARDNISFVSFFGVSKDSMDLEETRFDEGILFGSENKKSVYGLSLFCAECKNIFLTANITCIKICLLT